MYFITVLEQCLPFTVPQMRFLSERLTCVSKCQVKCEVIRKTSLGASYGSCQIVFVLKCCMLPGRRLCQNVGDWELGEVEVLLLRHSF